MDSLVSRQELRQDEDVTGAKSGFTRYLTNALSVFVDLFVMEPNTSISNAPPIFNGNDYAHWKVRMKTYLKGLNNNIWVTIEKGFERPNGDLEKWSKEDIVKSNWNNRGLSCIFNYVSSDEFRRITLCETSKEPWDILKKTHEGSKGVTKAKPQMLMSRFETVNIMEDEMFGEFYTKLSEIVNSMRGLGEKVPEITAVEESKDVELLEVDELIGSLITYESMRFSPKAKSIALKTTKKENKVVHEESSDDESFDFEPIAMLTWNFQKYLKNGYGHIKADYGNLKNAKENAMNASLSGELKSNDSDDKKGKKVVCMAFPATIQGSSDSVSAEIDGNAYEEILDEGSVKSCSHIVSHDTLVRNFTDARKKCKELLKQLADENQFLRNKMDGIRPAIEPSRVLEISNWLILEGI
ncbi:uncharacterized protein LOC132181859 [Corylus avellana]|uniref:uncharacterized protein LOC132181859 n=1 Tax=Corylus avellana TaxID=13451 RepID=UPI00286A4009|nr:uncharacterized protein LOC132181859 [Corylus avellana]